MLLRDPGHWWATGLLHGTALLLWMTLAPSFASAEPARPYRVGVLNEAYAANHPTVEGLKAGLRARGLVEGRDVAFEVHFTEGKSDLLASEAEALVKAKVDLIFTNNEAAALAAKDATKEIPIMFTLVANPIAAKVVADLARPGGNLTGIAGGGAQIAAKRLELLRTLSPKLRRVWFIYRAGEATDGAALGAITKAAQQLKFELLARSVATGDELKRILLEVRPGDGLLAPESETLDIPLALLEKSLKLRVPVVFAGGHWVSRGGLASYGPAMYAQGVQAAGVVAKIMQGARAQELPVESADDIALAVHLEAARLLGIEVPRKILFRADVIQR